MAAADDGSGQTQLYLRRLDQLQATPVPADDETVARGSNRLILVEGFSDELRKQLPAGGK